MCLTPKLVNTFGQSAMNLKMRPFWLTLTAGYISLLLVAPAAAWDPNAGLVQPLGGAARTVTVSSNPSGPTQNIIDGNDQTQWQSGACYPTGFVSRPELNPLLNACATPGRCVATAGSNNLNSPFDAIVYTGASVKAVGGRASLNVSLPAATEVLRVFFKGSWNSGTAQVVLVGEDGSRAVVATVTATANWTDQVVKGSWSAVKEVQVLSTDSFTLTELALQGAHCFETATVDMGAVFSVNLIRTRWWSPDSINTSLLISQDGVSWTVVRGDLVPNALPTLDLYFDDQPLLARYLSIKHLVNEQLGDWRKVYVWELAAYGPGGRWGLPPPVAPQTVSYRQLLGLNGIWGWGNGSFSDTLVKAGKGPLLYNTVASSGRNYQSMVWDVKKPGNDPKWDTMNKTGTDGQWWLDWDREYKAWKGAGVPVSVTYQFLAQQQPPSSWPDAYTTAYTLGYKFARHFGSSYGTGTVASFEAGNEPWDYNSTFYTQLLRGFIEGAYAGDAIGMKRLPCALQAHDPTAESSTGGHYIGARLPQDLAPKIDALNLHIYSFFNNASGARVAVHPEHPGSAMNGLHNMLSWRNANMPGVPVWVTEWGWDAYRPGETCGKATECVSQLAQAAYGIRGLSILARKGVAQSHWFFYANDDKCETLFCRSGLRDTYSRGYAELPVYHAFTAFIQMAGSARFSAAPVESSQLYVHVLSNQAGTRTHVLVWRPLPVGEAEQAEDVATLPFDVGFEAPGAAAAWRLSGALPGGKAASDLPSIRGTSWEMQVSSIPTLVVLSV